MSKAREFMRQAHSKTSKQAAVLTPSPIAMNGIKPAPQTPRPSAPPSQRFSTTRSAEVPTGVLQLARNDIDVTKYGVKPVPTNFNCYNKELFKWLREFSSNNQFSGGVPITKSQLIEIALDVVFYDLGINPIGYESQQALREDIQNRILEKQLI